MDQTPSCSTSSTGQRKKTFLAGLLIVLTTLAIYSPLFGNKFVIYDDPEYITENIHVTSGLTMQGLRWAFTSFEHNNWHPLTWLSHMLDVQLFGLNPAGHHATSLLIHTANSILLLLILRRMTGTVWRSGLVALLFAIHPLHVESVAWAAERKDLLCALFWLLTMRAYLPYADRPGWKRYLPVAVFFALGLLSKPMIVTLPCVLLLLDYWPLRRNGNPLSLVAEKIPLFLMSAGCSMITYRAQAAEVNSGVTINQFGWMNAVQSYVAYLLKTIWPTRLAVLYPFDLANITPWRTAGAALVILCLSAAVLLAFRRRPYLLVGWLWYLGTLVPVIGILQVGFQSCADRYTYLPSIGLFLIISWGLADLAASASARRTAAGATVIAAGILCVLTFRQAQRWENTITLMTHTIAATRNNWFVHNTLGSAYLLIGTTNRQVNISASLPLYPATPERRTLYLRKAAEEFSTSVSLYPSYLPARYNLQIAVAELEKLKSGGSSP